MMRRYYQKISSYILPVCLLYVIALSLNLYVSTHEIPANLTTDNSVDLANSTDVYNNGWHVWAQNGQSYTSVVVGYIAPSLARLFHTDVVNIYRYVFPCVYSFTPVLLYILYRKLIKPNMAFLGALFFATLPPSYQEIPTRGKSEVAEPIAVLALLVIFSNLKPKYKIPIASLLVVLTLWCHYSVGIMLLVWVGAMVLFSKQRLTIATIFAVGVISFFTYFHYAAGGELLSEIFHWNTLVYHADPITQLLLLSSNITMHPLAMPYVPVIRNTNMPQLWRVRAIIYADIALLVIGLFYLIRHREWMVKYREYLPFLSVSILMVLGALFIPFFTRGLYISAWIQFGAFSAGLLYGASTYYIPKWIPYTLLAGLLAVSIMKY